MGSPVGGPGAKGDSLADAARVLGISRQRATALAKRHGIEFQRLQATGKWTKQLRAMAAAKVALSDAARELGISRQRASAIAKRAGILFLRRPAAKRDRARKRLPGSCSECGGAMGEGRWVRCEKCRSAAAERERAKVAERRRAELCPSRPAPDESASARRHSRESPARCGLRRRSITPSALPSSPPFARHRTPTPPPEHSPSGNRAPQERPFILIRLLCTQPSRYLPCCDVRPRPPLSVSV